MPARWPEPSRDTGGAEETSPELGEIPRKETPQFAGIPGEKEHPPIELPIANKVLRPVGGPGAIAPTDDLNPSTSSGNNVSVVR